MQILFCRLKILTNSCRNLTIITLSEKNEGKVEWPTFWFWNKVTHQKGMIEQPLLHSFVSFVSKSPHQFHIVFDVTLQLHEFFNLLKFPKGSGYSFFNGDLLGTLLSAFKREKLRSRSSRPAETKKCIIAVIKSLKKSRSRPRKFSSAFTS